MSNKMLNYVSIAVFLSIVILILLYRINSSCETNNDDNDNNGNKDDNNYTKLSNFSNEINEKDIQLQNKHFLDKYIYQNLPPNNYEYLVNYPNGPFSWGEWNWGSNKSENCKGDCNYSTLNKRESKVGRGINLL